MKKKEELTKGIKKAICIFLAVIMAFGSFVALSVGSSHLQDYLHVKSMLSAYASEIVDTKGICGINSDAMLADNTVIDLKNLDGSNTVYLFCEPISFTDENGSIKTKDISVEKQCDNDLLSHGYNYANGQNDYRINFSQDITKGLLIEFENCKYSIVPQTDYPAAQGKKSSSVLLGEKFETFEYSGAFGAGTNLKFYPQLNGVKDEIVLNTNTGKNTFSFELKTENCDAVLNDDGTVSLIGRDDSSIVQIFSAPFAYDSKYIEGMKDKHYIDCSYQLDKTDDNTYIMTVTADKSWLESPDTSYPVVIDPVTSHIGNMYDLPIHTKRTTAGATVDNNAVGTSAEYGTSRSLIKFQKPSEIKSHAAINSAYYWTRELTGRTSSFKCGIYKITSSWNESSLWSTRPSYSTSLITSRNINSASTDVQNNPYWYKFNIKNLVQQWYTGTTNYGFMMKYEDEGNTTKNLRTFAQLEYGTSAWRPYTVINYTNDETPPTAASVTGNPTDWTKNNVTITVNGAKDNSGGIGLHSAAYSFSTVSGSYSWQADNKKTFSKNCTVYVCIRDAYNNIKYLGKQTISKIDKTPPVVPNASGAPTAWTNKGYTLIASSTDSQSGITAYSFSSKEGAYAWQSGNSKAFTGNRTVYIYTKDKAGNISAAKTVKISYVDTNYPVITNVSIQMNEDTNTKTATITATDKHSGIAGYSFDGGKTWQTQNTKIIDNSQSTVEAAVKDKAGNIAKSSNSSAIPVFYEENQLIGLINPNNTDDIIEYKIGENDSWHTYYVPFAVPVGQTARVEAKLKSSSAVLTREFSSKAIDFTGIYSESKTDLNISCGNASFDWARSYNSDDNKWFFSYESCIEKTDQSYLLKVIAPNASELIFVKKTDSSYYNESCGYELTVIHDTNNRIKGYSIGFDGVNYNYNENGVLTSVSDEFDNTVHFIYSDGNLSKITYGTDTVREYTVTTAADGKITSITTPLGEKLVYAYSQGNLSDVYYDKNTLNSSRESNIIVDSYEYTDGRISKNNGTAIEYNNAKLSKVTELNGAFTSYSFETFTDEESGEPLIKETVTSSDDETTQTCYNGALDIVKTVDTDGAVSEYMYDSNRNLCSEITDEDEAAYEYENNKLVSSVKNGVAATYEDDRIISEISDTQSTAYSYNENGDLLSAETKTIPDSEDNTALPVTTYTLTNTYENGILKSAEEFTLDSETGDTSTTITQYNTDRSISSTQTTSVTKSESEDSADLTSVDSTAYTYDEFGNTICSQSVSTDADGVETVSVLHYEFDALDRNIKISDNEGRIKEQYIYDPLSNVIYENIEGSESRTIYDDYARAVQEISSEDYKAELDGLKNTDAADSYADTSAGHTYTYAANGNLADETNRLGIKTNYTYFEKSSSVKSERFDGYVFQYDNSGNTLSVTVNGQKYADYQYNSDNNPTLVSYGNGQCVRYVYDERGNLTAQYHNADTQPYIVYSYALVDNTPDDITFEGDAIDGSEDFDTDPEVDIHTNEEYTLVSKTNYDTGRKTYFNGDTVTVKAIAADKAERQIYSYSKSQEEENTQAVIRSDRYAGGTDLLLTSDENSSVDSFTLSSSDDTCAFTYENTASDDSLSETTLKDSDGNSIINSKYSYDDNGNITAETISLHSEDITYRYTYDDQNRITSYTLNDAPLYGTDFNYKYNYHYDRETGYLVREDRNNGFNEGNTYLFSYDSRGNLTSNSTLRYVNPESSTDSIRKDYTTDFTLDNEIWADAITEINTDSKFIYDENGNPLNFDSIHFDWSEGRMLKSVEYSEDGMSLIDCRFTYNEKGIRTSKTVFGKTTYFTTDDDIITSQYQLDDEGNVIEEMIFLYDSSDNLLGFTYGGETYFYIKNHMGDVMGIADSNGTWLVKYYYQNAWGDISTQTVNDSAGRDIEALHTLGNLNPMRYKGYYYDREISMYYLRSRYYFPGITAKFLNADLPEFAKVGKEQYSGTNLFAY